MPPEPQNPPDGAHQGKKVNPPAFIVFLIVLVGLLGSFEIYKLYISPENQNNIQTTETQTAFLDTSATSTSLTASWQTYRNEEYGFEVKYPGDWQIAPQNPTLSHVLKMVGGELVNGGDYTITLTYNLYIDAYNGNVVSNLTKSFADKKIVKIAGIEAIRSSYKTSVPRPVNELFVETAVFYYRDKTFEIYFTTNGNTKPFDQILSTFKFIK